MAERTPLFVFDENGVRLATKPRGARTSKTAKCYEQFIAKSYPHFDQKELKSNFVFGLGSFRLTLRLTFFESNHLFKA